MPERRLVTIVGLIALHSGSLERLAGDLEGLGCGVRRWHCHPSVTRRDCGALYLVSDASAGVLHELGRAEEAEAAIRLAKESGAPDDIATQGYWRSAVAELAADNGRIAEAERALGEAIALVEPTDFLELRRRIFEAQARVEARAGRPDGWGAALARAIAEYEAKGDIVTPPRLRDRLTAGPA